jgi:hypothetical protein
MITLRGRQEAAHLVECRRTVPEQSPSRDTRDSCARIEGNSVLARTADGFRSEARDRSATAGRTACGPGFTRCLIAVPILQCGAVMARRCSLPHSAPCQIRRLQIRPYSWSACEMLRGNIADKSLFCGEQIDRHAYPLQRVAESILRSLENKNAEFEFPVPEAECLTIATPSHPYDTRA